jgi:ATP-dependent protease Clp ATPase subunit
VGLAEFGIVYVDEVDKLADLTLTLTLTLALTLTLTIALALSP